MNLEGIAGRALLEKGLLPGQQGRPEDIQRLGIERLRELAGADPAMQRAVLKRTAREFEGLFVYQMLAAMRKTVGEGGLIHKSQGQKIFEGMLDEELARKMAGRSGPGGLSEMLYRQLGRKMGLEEEDRAGAPPTLLELPTDRAALLRLQLGKTANE